MIISHKHRFIFFAIPKTGTHSVRQALREHLASDDLEQVGLFVQKQFNFPELSQNKSGHVSAIQILPAIGEEMFSSYFKFAFVRNPFDRFVSYCSFISRTSGEFNANPKAFMRHVLTELKPIEHLLYKPQNEFIVDSNGALAIDFVGRNENMQASYDSICEQIGIPSSTLEKINSTQHRHYSDYYDDELYDLVTEVYRKDIELFDYQRTS